MTSLPAAPLPVAFVGDDASRAAVQDAFRRRGVSVSLGGARDAADYVLTAGDGRLTLTAARRDTVIGFAMVAAGDGAAAAVALAPPVAQVVRWQRGLALQNHRTAMDRSALDVVYLEALDGGGERSHDGPETVLAYVDVGGAWRPIRGRLRVWNRTGQPLFVVLACFLEAYGIHILPTDGIAPADTWLTVWGDGPLDHFLLEDGADQSDDRLCQRETGQGGGGNSAAGRPRTGICRSCVLSSCCS